jgi:hypothetical protein
VGDGSCEALTLVAMKLAESLNIGILRKGLNCRKEVRVVLMWPDVYRDREEYIYTWLGAGEVREWTDVLLQHLPFITNSRHFCFTTPTPLPYTTDNIPSVRHTHSKAEQIILKSYQHWNYHILISYKQGKDF